MTNRQILKEIRSSIPKYISNDELLWIIASYNHRVIDNIRKDSRIVEYMADQDFIKEKRHKASQERLKKRLEKQEIEHQKTLIPGKIKL